ncbi:MAG: AI-2E family transporter, partial [Alphaproteobacteria bacterium]|nr:AI-2E family transporter [Alphaproteobacteria bacterium]
MSDAVPARELAAAPPPQVPPAGAPESSGMTSIIVAVIAVAALYWAREVLIPITLALLLSFVLSPLVNLLRRAWLGRVPSVIVAVILAIGIILAFGSVIGTQVAQLANDIPQYQTTIEKKIGSLREATVSKLSYHLKRLSRQFSAEPTAPSAPAPGA